MNKIKLAVFHAFFTQKGGGEKLIFDLRNNFNADLFAGAIHFKKYDPNSTDSFSQELFNTKYKLTYLHKDIDTLLLRLIKRFIFFGFSPKIKKLLEYEAIIFSGNVMFVQRRIKKLRDKFSADAKPKLIIYCHTPPRNLTDQFESFINSAPKGLKTAYKLGGKFILREYIKDIKQADFVITNSQNTHRRLLDYTGIDSTVIYPAVNTEKFKFISQQEFFLSYARLENMKRIPLLMEAFSRMPEKKLVICSTGPLHSWVADQIRKKNLTNISFKGLVTDEILVELVGNCLAGIYIPINEDFGITQLEIMSAGKPVIGVKEGGLLETIIDGETGVMIKSNPTVEDLIDAVKGLTPEKALEMKENCIEHAKKFSSKIFFDKIECELNELLAPGEKK